jgi:hypothetical protein
MSSRFSSNVCKQEAGADHVAGFPPNRRRHQQRPVAVKTPVVGKRPARRVYLHRSASAFSSLSGTKGLQRCSAPHSLH